MAELKPAGYQLVPLTKLLSGTRNAILICDGVGVGKTISAGYILCFLAAALQKPCLVVCPPGLQDKWYFELSTKFGMRVVPLRSKEELSLNCDYWNRGTSDPTVFVVPSSLLPQASRERFEGPIVIDEIHNLRNKATASWRAAKKLTESASHRVGLSATPINNSTSDLAAELSILLNLDIHVAEAVVEDSWRDGSRDPLYGMMTRFSKERLGIHFAKRVVHDVEVPVSEEYAAEVISIIKALRARPRSESIFRDEITYFRLAASSSKAFIASTGVRLQSDLYKCRVLLNILGQHVAERAIVSVAFEETARDVASSIVDRDTFILTGSVPVFQREEILSGFRGSPNGVLVMTAVGAEGIDLQFCSTLINFDLTWNPMVLEQRIGRIDRVGQQKPYITIYNMVVDGSIDERIIRTLGRKLGLVEGSVLEPATVLSTYSNSVQLFTDHELSVETKAAVALATAAEMSAAIIPQDYAILPEIDATYCDPGVLRDSAVRSFKPRWINDREPATVWHEEILRMRTRLDEMISRYNV